MKTTESYRPKITITKNKVTMAFSLISFMVGEIILIEKALDSPIDLELFPEINEEDFTELKHELFLLLKDTKTVELDEDEGVLLYLIVDIVCRCFVSEANLFLEQRAEKVMEIGKNEYKEVRLSYIHYAQELIKEINTKFDKCDRFISVRQRLADL